MPGKLAWFRAKVPGPSHHGTSITVSKSLNLRLSHSHLHTHIRHQAIQPPSPGCVGEARQLQRERFPPTSHPPPPSVQTQRGAKEERLTKALWSRTGLWGGLYITEDWRMVSREPADVPTLTIRLPPPLQFSPNPLGART